MMNCDCHNLTSHLRDNQISFSANYKLKLVPKLSITWAPSSNESKFSTSSWGFVPNQIIYIKIAFPYNTEKKYILSHWFWTDNFGHENNLCMLCVAAKSNTKLQYLVGNTFQTTTVKQVKKAPKNNYRCQFTIKTYSFLQDTLKYINVVYAQTSWFPNNAHAVNIHGHYNLKRNKWLVCSHQVELPSR